MSDFEIISVVIMTISLVLKAIKFGRDEKVSRHPALTGRRLLHNRGKEPNQKRHPFLSLL